MAGRLSSGLRALARRRAYLAAMAAALMVLLAGLLVLLSLAALWAWVMPAEWGIGSWGLVLALVLWLPFAAATLGFLSIGVRTYTLATSGPPPSSPAGVAGGLTGLGVSVLGSRLRRRRGPMGWLTDPWGSAAAEGLARTVPEGHPLAPLLAMAEEQQRNPPARGVGLLVLGIIAAGIGAWWLVAQSLPGIASLLLAPLFLLVLFAAVLGAALRGVLRGAWDRYLMDRMAAQAEAAAYAQRFGTYEPRP